MANSSSQSSKNSNRFPDRATTRRAQFHAPDSESRDALRFRIYGLHKRGADQAKAPPLRGQAVAPASSGGWAPSRAGVVQAYRVDNSAASIALEMSPTVRNRGVHARTASRIWAVSRSTGTFSSASSAPLNSNGSHPSPLRARVPDSFLLSRGRARQAQLLCIRHVRWFGGMSYIRTSYLFRFSTWQLRLLLSQQSHKFINRQLTLNDDRLEGLGSQSAAVAWHNDM